VAARVSTKRAPPRSALAAPARLARGSLYLWFPRATVLARALDALREAGRVVEQFEACLRVDLEHDQLDACILELGEALTEAESQKARALFTARSSPPDLGDFGRIVTLRDLHVIAQTGWLLEQLEKGSITSHFHPIVHAQDTTRVFAHEALLRGPDRNGAPVEPLTLLQLAREAGLLPQVDLAACRAAIREAARLDPDVTVFVNFSPAMMEDAESCLRAIVAAIDAARLRHDRFVFEVIEADRVPDAARLKRILDSYRRDGFGVALDDLGAGWSTLNLVHRLRPDFIKLDRDLVREVHQDPVKDLIASKLLEIGRGLGIRTIVEGVEEPEELQWARDRGADFVQGFLIAHPSRNPSVRGPG
jgi:EAL domain-containing protein (putative c-di-GMP-specific phosphodiesterase class I)